MSALFSTSPAILDDILNFIRNQVAAAATGNGTFLLVIIIPLLFIFLLRLAFQRPPNFPPGN